MALKGVFSSIYKVSRYMFVGWRVLPCCPMFLECLMDHEQQSSTLKHESLAEGEEVQ